MEVGGFDGEDPLQGQARQAAAARQMPPQQMAPDAAWGSMGAGIDPGFGADPAQQAWWGDAATDPGDSDGSSTTPGSEGDWSSGAGSGSASDDGDLLAESGLFGPGALDTWSGAAIPHYRAPGPSGWDEGFGHHSASGMAGPGGQAGPFDGPPEAPPALHARGGAGRQGGTPPAPAAPAAPAARVVKLEQPEPPPPPKTFSTLNPARLGAGSSQPSLPPKKPPPARSKSGAKSTTPPSDEEQLCPFCKSGSCKPAPGKKTRMRRKRDVPRQKQRFGRWWRMVGYDGPPYCQRCSEVFRDHLMRQTPNSAKCSRDNPCDDCGRVLVCFKRDSDEELWQRIDERNQSNKEKQAQKRKHGQGGTPETQTEPASGPAAGPAAGPASGPGPGEDAPRLYYPERYSDDDGRAVGGVVSFDPQVCQKTGLVRGGGVAGAEDPQAQMPGDVHLQLLPKRRCNKSLGGAVFMSMTLISVVALAAYGGIGSGGDTVRPPPPSLPDNHKSLT